MWEIIRTKIIEVISTATKVQAAYRTERSKFDGYPAAVVTPSDSEADYGDTAKDKLTFVFIVRIYQEISKSGQDQADITLEKAVDELLIIFLNKKALGTACEWVEPVNSRWGYQNRENSEIRVAELKLRCRKYLP